MCSVEDLTVDADIHGNIIDVETFDGIGREYIAAQFRAPIIDAVFCSNCGEYLFEGGLPSEGIDAIVKEHLERKKDALSS